MSSWLAEGQGAPDPLPRPQAHDREPADDGGREPRAVQRILRHSDPRITTEVYGHLQPDYLRSEIDRLRFGTAPASALLSSDSQPNAANGRRLLSTFL